MVPLCHNYGQTIVSSEQLTIDIWKPVKQKILHRKQAFNSTRSQSGTNLKKSLLWTISINLSWNFGTVFTGSKLWLTVKFQSGLLYSTPSAVNYILQDDVILRCPSPLLCIHRGPEAKRARAKTPRVQNVAEMNNNRYVTKLGTRVEAGCKTGWTTCKVGVILRRFIKNN